MIKLLLFAKLHPGLNTIPNNCVKENSLQLNSKEGLCYGRPLLFAKLHPGLNTIPNNCVKENSLQLNNKEGMCYGRPLLFAKLQPGLNTIPNNCVRENSPAQWLWYWPFFWAFYVRILPGPRISAMHLFICSFVMDFIRKKISI